MELVVQVLQPEEWELQYLRVAMVSPVLLPFVRGLAVVVPVPVVLVATEV